MSAVSGHYSPRVIGTIFLISFGIYLFLATVTYTPFDPGWMYVSSDTQQVSNASGVVGAWIADILYGLFGWAALLLPIFIFIEAAQVWWPRSYLTPIFRYAAQFFILLTSSALLYFAWQAPALSMTQAAGGIIGYEVAGSLAQILTTPLAVILLALFWFLLWTLAFKIEWMKTGETLAKVPSYLQDLFYKNVPAEEEDFDLSIAKPKNNTTAKDKSKDKSKEKAVVTQAQEHSPVEFDTDDFDQDFTDHLEQELEDQQKSKQIILSKTESKTVEPSQDERVIYSGEAWRPKQQDEQVAVDQPVKAKQSFQEYTAQQAVAQPVSQASLVSETPLNIDNQVDDIDRLIAQADSELQSLDTFSKPTQNAVPSRSNSAIDWGDDEFFDDLLAAVPVSKPDVKPSATSSVQVQNQVEQPSALSELEQFLAETEKETADLAKPATLVHQQPAKESLSKEEFIEAWQENAGKPEEFDWEDLDAPLTDASGRPVSRAMQVVANRKNLSPLPGFDLLDPVDPHKKVNYTAEQLARLSELLELKLQDFNVKAQVIEAHPGPVVTRFELDLAPGVKASKVTNISRDLARSMSMASVRVVEVIPGKPYIGIEVPNSSREMVRLIELLDTPAYRDPNALLSMAMGKDISGNPVLADLAKAPHMLVAGTTGSGKSVAVNSMLLSMLLKYTPKDLRLIMIDPKQLELANYNDIPHLLTPVVTDMKDAVSALNWCVNEMERRYKLMSLLKIRKLADYNRKVAEAIANGEDLIDPTWKASDSATQERAPRLTELPLIVIVADEFADMIMQVGKKAEEMITRLAQKSRAAGIHLLLATQRPTVDVVTGLIKANIPTRAALRVNSKIDSRTILDAGGAEDLLGHGDMLFLGPGKIEPERVHGAFISDDEVNRICDAWRERGSPNYVDEILTPYDEDGSSASSGDYESGDGADRDMLYDQCVSFVLETRKASASSLQRKFSLGYNRAARIIDQMEENGIVSPLGANGKRDIIV